MKSLLLTLGHNASAIYIDDNTNTVIGYEQERFDKKKASSSFPKDAIEEIRKQREHNTSEYDNLIMTHWFDKYDFYQYNDLKYPKLSKYYDANYVKNNISYSNIITLNSNCTHHDAHFYSAKAFFRENVDKKLLSGDKILHFLVVDGFGTKQEVLTLYKLKASELLLKTIEPKVVLKVYGYSNSLGLMYQYATGFVGMKENEDEYKFLGYESHIQEVLDNFTHINSYIQTYSSRIISEMINGDTFYPITNESDDLLSYKDLNFARQEWYDVFGKVVDLLGESSYGTSADEMFKKRTIIGYFIQSVLENVLSGIVKIYDIQNLIVTGGVFYNVKLNNRLLNETTGLFCACPIAGDQGLGIGLYEKYIGDFPFSGLKWGDRDIYSTFMSKNDYNNVEGKPYYTLNNDENVILVDNVSDYIHVVSELLAEDCIVNVVKGGMEFGPRALCNTTTYALPTEENVQLINTLNKRNTVMPMAPVMTKGTGERIFRTDINRVVGSDKYMIITYDYTDDFVKNNPECAGVMHKYPLEYKFSGRPQFVEPLSTEAGILNSLEIKTSKNILINTSFNVHGNPIVLSVEDALYNYNEQKKQAKTINAEHRVYLVFYQGLSGE